MNLIKNVDGDPKLWKGKVRQDLDTIQRNFNALQAQVDAIVIPDTTPPAVISSANTVTTFDDNFLRSVAVKPLSGLSGKGTITDPLDFSGSSGVVVDPAGALDGDGTSGDPLAVRVDGVTITINGSNELEAAGATPPLLLTATFTISDAQMQTLNSLPVTLLAGAVGFLFVPVMLVGHTQQDTQFASTVSTSLRYSTNVDDLTNPCVMIRGSLSPGNLYHISSFATPVANVTPATTIDPTVSPIGASVVFRGNTNSANAGGGLATQIRLTLYYLKVAA